MVAEKVAYSQIVEVIPLGTAKEVKALKEKLDDDFRRYTSEFIVVSQDITHFELLFMTVGKALPNEATKSAKYLPLQFSLMNSEYYLNLTKNFEEESKLFLYDEGTVICFSKALPH